MVNLGCRKGWPMLKTFNIAVFEGDGIGPEVLAPALEILKHLAGSTSEYAFAFDVCPAGAGCYLETGCAMPAKSLKTARTADAILLSAMGLPGVRYDDGTEITPQIDLRMELSLYAGLRPVRTVPGQVSPLASAATNPIDFVLIRESTEGLFYSQGKGEVRKDEAFETLRISRTTSEKLFRKAFELAATRKETGHGKGLVTCVDKANVFRAFAFFREIFDQEASHHPAISSGHVYVDAMALKMIECPWRFDVLVTENMFGDILSDLGAGLMGGLGMAPSADIGDSHAVFQPCHGTAPDIAGSGCANPIAMIRSAAMMLDWLGKRHGLAALVADAGKLDRAVDSVITDGRVLTPDIGGTSGTGEVASAILAELG